MVYEKNKGKSCSVLACSRAAITKGLCSTHYTRRRKTGDTGTAELPDRQKNQGDCSVEGCSRSARTKGMCQMHYLRVKQTGVTGPAEPVFVRMKNPECCTVEGWVNRAMRRRNAFVEPIYRAKVYESCHKACAYCWCALPPTGWELDHIVPLAKQGQHSYANVVASCPECNNKKSDNDLTDFLQGTHYRQRVLA